jgi:hypothetical protein
MEHKSSYRPRVSRETRLLLTAGVAAIAVLWVLARIRFQDRPVIANSVPSVLAQLNSGVTFDGLASEIAGLQTRLRPWLMAVEIPSETPPAGSPSRIVALRLRDNLAIALLPAGASLAERSRGDIQALDPASRLAVIRVSDSVAAPRPIAWRPDRSREPRYVAVSDIAAASVSVRPAFVSLLVLTESELWPGQVWAVPAGSDMTPGSFVFTIDAELVGLVAATPEGSVIVPGETILAEGERILGGSERIAGTVGIEVQPLTESIGSLTGARTGVVVTWLGSDGPAAGALSPGDVIEAVDGRDLSSREAWDARIARLSAGETLALRVRRRGEILQISLEARPSAPASVGGTLGLSLRARTGVGTEVTGVQPAAAGARAGLAVGDVITLFNDVRAPTPAQITRSFAAIRKDDRVIVAVTRGETHLVTVLGR